MTAFFSINLALLTSVLLTPAHCYDCYDKKCQGTGDFSDVCIDCDQRYNRCVTDRWGSGFPECRPGPGGEGVSCKDGTYYCYANKDGEAYCGYASSRSNWVIYGPCLGGGVVLILIIFCLCCRLQRPVNQHTVIVQPPGDLPYNYPWVVQTSGSVPPLQQPPYYGATAEYNGHPAPAYTEPQTSNQYYGDPPPYTAFVPTAPPHDELIENSLYPSI